MTAAGAGTPAATTGGLSVTFTWDWRQQPPMDAIGQRIRELTGGTVTMDMPETGTDEYELVITRQPAPAGLRDALVDAIVRWSGCDAFDQCASELAAILDRYAAEAGVKP